MEEKDVPEEVEHKGDGQEGEGRHLPRILCYQACRPGIKYVKFRIEQGERYHPVYTGTQPALFASCSAGSACQRMGPERRRTYCVEAAAHEVVA